MNAYAIITMYGRNSLRGLATSKLKTMNEARNRTHPPAIAIHLLNVVFLYCSTSVQNSLTASSVMSMNIAPNVTWLYSMEPMRAATNVAPVIVRTISFFIIIVFMLVVLYLQSFLSPPKFRYRCCFPSGCRRKSPRCVRPMGVCRKSSRHLRQK